MMTPTQTPPIHSYAHEVLTGGSPAAVRLRLQIARIAPHFRIALLTGEPGSGKHALAACMHTASPAGGQAFTAIPALDFAGGARPAALVGTLYLPGLEALDAAAQVGLLRSLGSLDRATRIVLASRGDLKGMASAGRLRADLYERVGTLQIRVAPLAERPDDIAAIAQSMLDRLASRATLTESACARLREHSWPGNLRELWNLCESLAAGDAPLDAVDLEPHLSRRHDPPHSTRLEEVIERHVLDVLESCSGNKLRAAELLGISRSTLYRMLEASSQPAVV
jgi:DNA-binding NtrC family response regulator